MARYFDIHPDNPQRRSIGQVVDLLREDGLIAYPTDSCYALGCQLGNRDGIDDWTGMKNCAEGLNRLLHPCERKGVTRCM